MILRPLLRFDVNWWKKLKKIIVYIFSQKSWKILLNNWEKINCSFPSFIMYFNPILLHLSFIHFFHLLNYYPLFLMQFLFFCDFSSFPPITPLLSLLLNWRRVICCGFFFFVSCCRDLVPHSPAKKSTPTGKNCWHEVK